MDPKVEKVEKKESQCWDGGELVAPEIVTIGLKENDNSLIEGRNMDPSKEK